MLGQPEAGNQPSLSTKLVSKYHRIDAATLEQVGRYAQSQGISVGNLLKGLYGLLINNYCRPEEDFYIRETRAGRGSSSSAFTDSIGPCHQMVPFLFRSSHLKGPHGIQNLIADINTFNADRRPFSALSLVTQNQLAPQGRIGFMFNFYHFDNRIEMTDRIAHISTHAPLELQGQVQLIIHQEDGELQLAMHYQNDVFADHRLLERLESLCQQLIKGVERVDQLNFLLAEEERTLATFNPSLPAFEQFPVHQRFEQMAAQFGERIAVVCEDQELSYAQLNVRANQLARELVAQGIDIGSFVGLCLERSTDLMVGILGILKAGAAYVPLDPHFPSDRLAFILEDSQAQVL
jgi:non-ribosomal peptide synthetase component F